MRVLLWHVHGSWTTAFVHGEHEYLLPVLPDRGPDGRGRARTWNWPAAAVELAPQQLRDAEIDLVVLQRPHEAQLVEQWGGRTPGRDLPAVYLEHDAPHPAAATSRHPMADGAIPIVHVTHFNATFWDCGTTPTHVVEHGVVDPGERYDGGLPHAAVVVNEPVRRGRTVGTDLLLALARDLPIDVFGMSDGPLPGTWQAGDVPQERMHDELARRRLYLHLTRWTSLGLSLVEAMHLGLPVVGLSATEIHEAVPPEAGVLSSNPAVLRSAALRFLADPECARVAGKAARAHALARYGLDRFLRDWDRVIEEVVR